MRTRKTLPMELIRLQSETLETSFYKPSYKFNQQRKVIKGEYSGYLQDNFSLLSQRLFIGWCRNTLLLLKLNLFRPSLYFLVFAFNLVYYHQFVKFFNKSKSFLLRKIFNHTLTQFIICILLHIQVFTAVLLTLYCIEYSYHIRVTLIKSTFFIKFLIQTINLGLNGYFVLINLFIQLLYSF